MSTTVVETQAEQPTSPSVKPDGWDNNKLVEKFVALRDKVAEIKKRHKEELAKYNVVMATLEGWLKQELLTSGSESIRTSAGTFYKTTQTSVTCNEWSKTLEWIKDNDAWELLEARVSKTAALEILKDLADKAAQAREAGQQVDPESLVIPGVVISRELEVGVRKS